MLQGGREKGALLVLIDADEPVVVIVVAVPPVLDAFDVVLVEERPDLDDPEFEFVDRVFTSSIMR